MPDKQPSPAKAELNHVTVSIASAGSEDEPVILENAICDGCGKVNLYVQVINQAPAANICLCRGCIEAEPPNTRI
jgi:hypothetical protein